MFPALLVTQHYGGRRPTVTTRLSLYCCRTELTLGMLMSGGALRSMEAASREVARVLLDHGAKIEDYKAFEPADTEFIVIQGGNHAQFGDYGPQPGDNPATISPESQWQQTTDATVQFLASFAP